MKKNSIHANKKKIKFKKIYFVYIAYTVTIFLWIYLSNRNEVWPFHRVDPTATTNLHTESYALSFLASFLEDLVLFGFLGIVIYKLNSRPFHKENFATRVESLANNESISDKARDFLFENVKEILAYIEMTELTIHLSEINTSGDCDKLFIYVTIESRIVNMCSDIDYEVDTLPHVFPGEEVDGNYGVVNYLGIKNESFPFKEHAVIKDKYHNMTNRDKVGEPIEDFKIPRGESGLAKSSFGVWMKYNEFLENPNDWFFLFVQRFTEEVKVEIINETGTDLKYDIRIYDKKEDTRIDESKGIVIKNNDSAEFLRKDIFEPKDRLEICFNSSD